MKIRNLLKSTVRLCLAPIIGLLSGSLYAQSPLLDHFTPPEDITVGDTVVFKVPAKSTTDDIQEWIDRAVRKCSPEHTVRLEFHPKASYRVNGPPDSVGSVLKIENSAGNIPQNLVIDGKGCTFTVTSWSRFMRITRAQNVILKNFRVTYEPKNITQGVITEIVDPGKGLYEVKIDPGHPMPDGPRFTTSELRWIMVMEQQEDGTWGLKPGFPTTIGWKSERYPIRTGERSFTLKLSASMDHGRLHGPYQNNPLLLDTIEQGDRIAILSRSNSTGVFAAMECHTLVYRDIEINHSPASAFGDQYGERNCYVGITVRPAPGHLFTTTADGIFVTNQRNGPWIEDCSLQGIGDDAVVLKNTVGIFKGLTENKALPYEIGGHDSTWFSVLPGDRLAVYDMSQRTLVSRHKVLAVSSERPMKDKQVQLDEPFPFEPGNADLWIYNLDNQCNGFVLKNNTFIDHRRWGVLCSGADGSIISNRFIRSQNAAIYLVNSDNYFDNKTGAVPRNIEIIGNHFEGSWHAQSAHPFGVIAARMNGHLEHTRGEPPRAAYGNDWNGITNIRIKDNVFRNWRPSTQFPPESRSENLTKRPIHGLDLRDVSDVTITGNQFFPSDQLDSSSKAIRLNDFSGVTIKDNTFHQWPGGREQAISRSGGRDTSQNASRSPLTMGGRKLERRIPVEKLNRDAHVQEPSEWPSKKQR